MLRVGWWIERREKKRGRVVDKKERMIRPQTDPGSQTICSGGAGRMASPEIMDNGGARSALCSVTDPRD